MRQRPAQGAASVGAAGVVLPWGACLLVSYRPLATPKRAGALEAAPGRVDTLARYDRVRDAARARLVATATHQILYRRALDTASSHATGPLGASRRRRGVGGTPACAPAPTAETIWTMAGIDRPPCAGVMIHQRRARHP